MGPSSTAWSDCSGMAGQNYKKVKLITFYAVKHIILT